MKKKKIKTTQEQAEIIGKINSIVHVEMGIEQEDILPDKNIEGPYLEKIISECEKLFGEIDREYRKTIKLVMNISGYMIMCS